MLKAIASDSDGLGSTSILTSPFAARMQLIATRAGGNGQQNAPGGSNPYLNQYTRHVCPYGADAIQLVYAGFYQDLSTCIETAQPPTMFYATGVTLNGGSSYVAGEIMTYALTNTTGATAVKVMVTQVATGVPMQYVIVDPGAYNTLLAGGAAQSSTTGSGTGATATFTWASASVVGKVGIEPVFGGGAATTTGLNAIQAVRKGAKADGLANNTILVPSNDFYVSDPISVDVAVGAAIGLRAQFAYSGFTLGRIPMITAYGAASQIEEANKIATWFDQSLSGTITPGASSTIFQPIAILGVPKTVGPTLMCIGTSIEYGFGSGTGSIGSNLYDLMDANGNLGWFEKACGLNGYPYSNLAKGSDSLEAAIPASSNALTGRIGRYRAIAMAQPTAVLLQMVTNSANNGDSLATILAKEQQMVQELKGLGVRYVFTATSFPRTTSSDNFATTANQTFSAGSPVLIARDTALRNGTYAAGYDWYVDISSACESSVGSGIWKVDGVANTPTHDGTHPSPAYHNAAAVLLAASLSTNLKL